MTEQEIVQPPLKLPKKRLLVFAAISSSRAQLESLRYCDVDAVMHSFMKVRSDGLKQRKHVRETLESWDVIRYLDSGAFTFLHSAGKLRVRQKKSDEDKKGSAVPSLEEMNSYAEEYMEYLRTNHSQWDWIVELDVDEIYGTDISLSYRKKLRAIVGDKLIPVWHPIAGLDAWTDMCSSFPYVGVGSDHPTNIEFYRNLVTQAKINGNIIHGFGEQRMEVLKRVPYDTADSTSWKVGPWRGRYGPFSATKKDMTHADLSRARALVKALDKQGISIERLVNGKVSDMLTSIIPIKDLLKRQDQLQKWTHDNSYIIESFL